MTTKKFYSIGFTEEENKILMQESQKKGIKVIQFIRELIYNKLGKKIAELRKEK